MEQVRAFIAIELPIELKNALSQLQNKLKTGREPVKWVDPASIHLTLKFLGNISSDNIPRVTKVLEQAAQGCEPVCLEAKGLGVFPNLRRIQIIWVGLGGELERLGRFQQSIEAGLAPLGFAPETRPFKPHLTLGRVRDNINPAERQTLEKVVSGTGFDVAYPIDAGIIHLVRSLLTREGAIYTRIASVNLPRQS